MGELESIMVRIDPDYPFFGLIGEPVPNKQHPNQQKGLDLYVSVVNLDTGERCFKKLYDGKKGLHFKHTGYISDVSKRFRRTWHRLPISVPCGTIPMTMTPQEKIVGTLWVENDRRFVRVVEVVSDGQRIGRKTISIDGVPSHSARVTYGDAHKFFKTFQRLGDQ